jgi:formate C-acetyltransferase
MGATLEEARDYCMSGCVINTIPGKTAATYPINVMMPRVFEVTLCDGANPVTGRQLGPKTGKFEDMKSYDEIYQAYLTQLKFFITENAEDINRIRIFRAETYPQVFRAALVDDCIKRGEDPHGGGARYQNSSMYVIPIGIIDVVDCLSAIKKLVFEDRRLTAAKVMEAIGANFDGYEDIRRMLMTAPKYGNDDDFADDIAVDLYAQVVKISGETDACYGGKWVVAPHTLAFHGSLGRKVGALPSGRMAGESSAEGGASPSQGADTHGPTATINSAGKIDQLPIYTPLFNMKFHPSALATRDDLQKFIGMLKTYFDDYGGKHMQFNVVSRETLLDAQVNPDNYRNLVVRVAGYSALWVELERTIQDEVIARSTKSW